MSDPASIPTLCSNPPAALAAFWWDQPGWLVLALVLAAGTAAFLRVRRAARARAALPPAAGTHGGLLPGLPVLAAVLAMLAAALVGLWLQKLVSSLAAALLGAAAFVAAVWLIGRAYRPQWGAVSPLGRGALLLLRITAAGLLLLLIAGPVWERVQLDWRKPLLVALLDQSESMAIADAEGGQSRAAQANAALEQARAELERLTERYDVRLLSAGTQTRPLPAWQIEPRDAVSALAGALREAGQMRAANGAPPAAVLLLSDGAENAASSRSLRDAAAELAARGIALLAFGVGPGPGQMPMVDLDPLAVPAQIGLRDRLRVPITGRVQGSAGGNAALELLWGAEPAVFHPVQIARDIQPLDLELETTPPEPGIHRLTAQVKLPENVGGQIFQTSTVIEVRDERIRVLYLDDTPRAEGAFVARALLADPRFELVRKYLFDAERNPPWPSRPDPWAGFDVIILGRLPPRLPDAQLAALAAAVSEQGVGLALVGGRPLFNDQDYSTTPLATLSPVLLAPNQQGLEGPLAFTPTSTGERHPVLYGLAPSGFAGLPPLGGAARFGRPKPVSTLLAVDGRGRPLLAVNEVGRGRTAAAAWESTWHWALASEAGLELHRQLWRQLVRWLANRRPRAWVLTDEPSYALAPLTAGQRRVRIRAGLSGLEPGSGIAAGPATTAHLELLAGHERRPVRLQQAGGQWTAELPAAEVGPLTAGEYILEFRLTGFAAVDTGTPAGAAQDALAARTAFRVVEMQLEHQPPTANLPLLRAAAEQTAAHGGSFHGIDALPRTLETLARQDRREEVRTRIRYAAAEREPWVLLIGLAAALGLEWAIRKRIGMA